MDALATKEESTAGTELETTSDEQQISEARDLFNSLEGRRSEQIEQIKQINTHLIEVKQLQEHLLALAPVARDEAELERIGNAVGGLETIINRAVDNHPTVIRPPSILTEVVEKDPGQLTTSAQPQEDTRNEETTISVEDQSLAPSQTQGIGRRQFLKQIGGAAGTATIGGFAGIGVSAVAEKAGVFDHMANFLKRFLPSDNSPVASGPMRGTPPIIQDAPKREFSPTPTKESTPTMERYPETPPTPTRIPPRNDQIPTSTPSFGKEPTATPIKPVTPFPTETPVPQMRPKDIPTPTPFATNTPIRR